MNTYAVTDYDIQALVDNELGHERAKQVQAHIDQNLRARKRYQELKEQKDLLKSWWKNNQQ